MTSWRLLPILWSTSFILLLFSWVMWRGRCSLGCLLENTQGDQANRNCRAVLRLGLCSCEQVDLLGTAEICLQEAQGNRGLPGGHRLHARFKWDLVLSS